MSWDCDPRDYADPREREDLNIYDDRWLDDPRALDDRERDFERECDPRDHDPRDAFVDGLELPRGLERELVQDDRENLYELNREDGRMLATIGAFRVIAERDLEAVRDPEWDPRDDTLEHLRDERLIRGVDIDIGERAFVLTDDGSELLEANRRERDDDERQELHAEISRPRELEHDSELFAAYLAVEERLRDQGADIERVVLETRELTIRAEKAKTRRARRLPISSRLLAVLEMRRLDPSGRPYPPEAYVFGNRLGERVTSIRTAWENARQAAGLNGFQLRDLRHEAASRFEEAGVLTTDVSKFLGHRNLSTTTRYLNTTSRRLRLALLRVEQQARSKAESLANSCKETPDGPSHADDAEASSTPSKSLVS